jgi:NAD(P)-dependent dehydrogenase (short-subunit alcohol dehydrogenase family)
MKLHNKVAVITGVGSGIGKAVAELFSREGAAIAGLDQDESSMQATLKALDSSGSKSLGVRVDVSNPGEVRNALDQAFEKFSRIDIICTIAGINGVWAPIDELEPEEWDRTLDINLKGTYHFFRYGVPLMRKNQNPPGGVFLTTASLHGTRTYTIPGSVAYACSKSGVTTLTKKMALELARDRIRVNVICPGATVTNINDRSPRRNTQKVDLQIQYGCGQIPLLGNQRLSPEQVAKSYLFLASDDADAITGTEIWVDGGMSLVMG